MNVQPVDNINFRIYKGSKATRYGEYTWGEYKGLKFEVFNASKNYQKLIYVSKAMNFIKSKLIYWVDGVKKVTRAEGRR